MVSRTCILDNFVPPLPPTDTPMPTQNFATAGAPMTIATTNYVAYRFNFGLHAEVRARPRASLAVSVR